MPHRREAFCFAKPDLRQKAPDTMPQDPMVQLALFTQAVEALGGQRVTARTLGVDERDLRARLSGEEDLDTSILRDIAKALIDHADRCRKIERKLSPAFSENLTAIQAERFGNPG
ncbi:hypothetical protein TQ38_015230 [Novosphingobium sp. P6W]|nr:hypothetical protein TQ38_015230 [Novosphingobium sp. P6W]